ncbi:tRNA preQ1(34) S-adenosylmethionine ribosyltransferase-isomerase QueA [Methylotenera versatilis]|uniref:tRNA preQ1(34) S-adenosylmethionine ribosyltransferase-isomerase QueA n=1 Tax=Methylotenera versatilis TaxID=1055487 RepID=UPI000645CEBB|nr:tRNA preQ1(34) S-adenosylmethionine ribosyltransferase-isomerase QueA [Methylotenera versatilis]
MRTQDFDFYLPDTLIAQHPSSKRNASKLLYLNSQFKQLSDELFINLPNFLSAGDLLVFNDTRVIKARLFGIKDTGGQVEVLVERVLDNHHVLAHVRASRAPKAGNTLRLADAFDAKVIGREDDLFQLQFIGNISALDLLERYGALPLPPYITHSANAEDDERYQTVYAKHAGAVAAPTAGLHFDEPMLNTLKAKGIGIAYVTLHVGAGTFQPVRVDEIKDHKMHSEIYHISAETVAAIDATKLAGGNVIAVGTTSLRALESAALNGSIKAGSAETAIFITPGFQFKIVDKLLTNFHLPKSTLLMLVSAFAGFEQIKQAYAHAIEKQYRFFSYGDAMLIEKSELAQKLGQ